jgi:hypothetical protein
MNNDGLPAPLALGSAFQKGYLARGECGGFSWEARATGLVPYLTLYPILALEDPAAASLYVVWKVFDNSAYWNGLGTATLWDVRHRQARSRVQGSLKRSQDD